LEGLHGQLDPLLALDGLVLVEDGEEVAELDLLKLTEDLNSDVLTDGLVVLGLVLKQLLKLFLGEWRIA